ncbi:MAG: metallophosphoesterase family protein, partial [Pseudomonadota bacterium]
AIGDVHGCLESLCEVHAWIEDDLARRSVADHRIIHLGDFIDRGPDNPGVLDHMIARAASDPRVLSVRGNHDFYLMDFLNDPDGESYWRWASYGGAKTIADYGVSLPVDPNATASERAAIHAALDTPKVRAHAEFIASLPLWLSFGDYLFVHAGIRPGVGIAEQTEHDLMWMREPFLSWPDALEQVVVHGHTPTDDIDVRPNRIGIDTGCVFGGELTCLVLGGSEASRLVGPWLERLIREAAP